MRPARGWTRRAVLSGALGLGIARQAAAQEAWPQRPLRLIVALAPGGTADIIARQYAEFLQQRLGQTVVVENRAGASTNIGTEAAVRAAPDGHTLLLGASNLASNPVVGPKPPFDPITALDPVGVVANAPFLLCANPRFAAKDAAEMIRLARQSPGRYTVATAQLDFRVAELTRRSGIVLEHVGYRGGAEAMTAVIAGHIDMVYSQVPTLLGAVRDGALVALGTTGRRRSPSLPAVPTFLETGESSLVSDGWYGIFTTARAPHAAIARLAAETQDFARDPRTIARFRDAGMEAQGSTPEELGQALRELTADFTALATELGLLAR
jgi:tripartite-type tricarboxylate transporter receptor subunit TctC